MAVSVTDAGLGTLEGAIYVTGTPEALVDGETVPHASPVQPFPVSVQVTPLFCASLVTVAVTCAVKVSGTKAAVAETLTDTAGVMLMAAAAV